MNGVHDMGGMHGMGPIQYESNEPVFHEAWEARIFALYRAMRAWPKWTADASRHAVELIPAPEYLSMSYYEQRLHALIELMVKSGLVTRAEAESGKAVPGSPTATPALIASAVPAMVAKGKPASREVPVAARFTVGQRVLARNLHPTGHTRLPRYARGKLGTIHRDHGVHVFPDTNAHSLGEKPQHLYSVRFAARELWGEQAQSAMPCILICGMTTLSAPKSMLDPERLQALPQLPGEKGEPMFAEPWQAQAFALAVKLSEQGHFTWKEWAATLANELKAATSRGEPDDSSHYYDHWLAALEHLATIKGLVDSTSLAARKAAWADAYRSTPHGVPVKLAPDMVS